MSTKKKKNGKYSSLILLFSIGISVFLIYLISRDLERIRAFIIDFGVWGPLICVLLFGVLSLTPISSDPIMLINGALFGPIIGALTNWMGNNLASILEYYIGKNIGDIADFENKRKHLPFGLGKIPANSVWFLFFGRFIPQFGGKLVSLSAGLYRVSFWKYFWSSVTANFIGSILVALGGNELLSRF